MNSIAELCAMTENRFCYFADTRICIPLHKNCTWQSFKKKNLIAAFQIIYAVRT